MAATALTPLRLFVPLLLGLFLACPAWAGSALDAWRDEVAGTRKLAENDIPRAYEQAKRLQATLPADAMPADRARLLNLLARIEVYLALTVAADKNVQAAKALAKQHGDAVGQIEADLNVALNAVNQARIDEVVAATTDAMKMLDGVDRPDLLAEAMLRTSMMHRRLGHFDDSVTLAMQTMDIARRGNDPLALTYAYQGLAIAYDLSGRKQEARQYFIQMRDQARAAGSRLLEAGALLGLGGTTAALGDVRAGEMQLREAVAIYRSAGGPFYVAHGLFILADTLGRQQRYAVALPLFDEAAAIYERYHNKIALWWTYNARSESRQALGRLDAARADAEHGYTLAKEIGLPIYLGGSAKRLAALAAARGDHRQAYAFSVEAAEMADKTTRQDAGSRMIELAERYQAESRQREIDELIRQNERHALEQRWLWTVLGGSLVMLATTASFLLRQRRANRLLEVLNTQVRHSQNKLQATLDAIPDLLLVLGLDGRYYDVHAPRPELLAAAPADLIGKTIADVLPRDAVETCYAALREAEATGLSIGKQLVLPLPRGEAWFELSVSRKPVAPGEEPRFIVLSRDITERKRMEEALRRREQEFRSLAESSTDSIIRYDLDHRILYLNGLLVRYLGLASADEVIGRRPIEIWPDGRYAVIDEAAARAVETGSAAIAEFTEPVEGGAPRYHHITVVPERDAAGTIIGTIAFGRELTAIREAERKLRTLVEHLPDFIARFDRECRHVYVNPAIVRAFGAPAEHFIGKTVSELEPVERRPQYAHLDDGIRQAFADGKINRTEARWMLPAGERCFEILHVPEKDESGSVISVLGIARDITERKEYIRDLQRWHDIFEHAEWGVVVGSADGRTLELMNPAFARMHGYAVEELTGRPIVDVFAPQSREALPAQVSIAHQQGHHSFEAWHLRKDGTTFPVFIEITAVRGPDGKILHRIVNVQDITERKRAEEDLRRSEERYRGLYANTPVMLHSIDENGVLVSVSDYWLSHMGFRREEVIGRKSAEFLTEASRRYAMEEVLPAFMQTGVCKDVQYQFVKKDGSVMDGLLSAIAERDEAGRIVRSLAVVVDITERKLAEDALRVSEEKYRTLIQKIQAAVVVHGADRRILTSNPAAQAIFGLSEAQLDGKAAIDPAWHFVREDGSPAPVEAFPVNIVLASRKPLRNQALGVHRPGHAEDVWVLVNADPVFDTEGEISQVIVTFIDITQRKRAEEALAVREREFRTLAENIPDNIIRYDTQARKIYVNPSVARLMGTDPAKLLGQTPEETPPEIRAMQIDEFSKRLGLVLETGEPQELEVSLRHAVEGMQIHNVKFVAERDEQGRIVGAMAVGRDITRKKHLEDELAYRERKYRTLAENSPNLIIRYDRDCRRVFVNPAYVRETGLSAEEALSAEPAPQWAASMTISAQDYRAALERVMATGQQLGIQLGWRHVKTGRLCDYAVQIAAEHRPDGKVVGALVIAHNITVLKEAQYRLEASQAELRGLAARLEAVREEERKRIARDMHDELGQYLTALRLEISILRMQSSGSDPAILEQAQALSVLVDKTIQVVRDIAATLRPAPLDMGVISALEWLANEFTRRTGILCELDTDEKEVTLDDVHSTAVFRMVQESLTNVARHSEASQVEIHFKREEENFLLEVNDNGKGFDSSAPREKSFGLVGLRERAMLLGAEAAISSAPDRGTTVRVRIPISTVETET